ncbi:hypothetical protein DFJ73DRAFT_873040 [Zopfochytrium polystomum]|nr:hypothetical protein DFJ73DRAFT_873040 [Zopfochytrium polystomum]
MGASHRQCRPGCWLALLTNTRTCIFALVLALRGLSHRTHFWIAIVLSRCDPFVIHHIVLIGLVCRKETFCQSAL